MLREVPFETKVFERYSRVEKALENAIIESHITYIFVDAAYYKVRDGTKYLNEALACDFWWRWISTRCFLVENRWCNPFRYS